ncbi:hypothetical protein AgCh_037043 [Apium graveolens]
MSAPKIQSHIPSNIQANTVFLDCPIDKSKYNFQYYSIHTTQSHIFACNVSTHPSYKEPYTYNQAASDPRWVEAMHKELTALETNITWEIVALPPGKKIVGCKWVYKAKFLADGSLDKFKARLVAKGYTQIKGKDYHSTFAPVVKMSTVRTVLALATVKKWPIHQLDINNAFLHGDLIEEVYMKIPKGHPLYSTPNAVCRLLKSLYGLKQASRQWFAKLVTVLLGLGFVQAVADYSLFTYTKGSSFIIALVYVDDILLTGNDQSVIEHIKSVLHSSFTIKDLGLVKYYLGLEIHRTGDGLFLHQHKFVYDMLVDAGLEHAKPLSLPLDSTIKLTTDDGILLDDPSIYRKFVGKLLYLTVSRPDISFMVHHLSQFLQTPRVPHLRAVQRVLRYLKATPFQGLYYDAKSSIGLTAYCDSDWGLVFILHGVLVVIAVNGKFSGPTFNVTTNENVIVNVRNKLNENALVTWPEFKCVVFLGKMGFLALTVPFDQGGTGPMSFRSRIRLVASFTFRRSTFRGHQALRTSLDSGKDLGMTDGVLINGKGPYQYNASVPNGIDYETINVDQESEVLDNWALGHFTSTDCVGDLYIHTGALPDPPNDAYDTSYAVNQAMSIRLWLLEYCATDEALSGMHPGQAALDIAVDPVFHPKTKHFAMDCHYVREQVLSGLIRPVYIPSNQQLADVLTKGLPRQSHWHILSNLNVKQAHSI